MVEDALEEGEIEGLVNEPSSEQVRAEHIMVDIMPSLLQGYSTKAEFFFLCRRGLCIHLMTREGCMEKGAKRSRKS